MTASNSQLPPGYEFVDRSTLDPSGIMQLRKLVGWDADSTEVWRATLADAPVFVAVTRSGELVGMAYAAGTKRHAVLCDLCVHPDHQGQKIGLAITRELLRQCDSFGFRYLYGEMSAENPFTELFREHGFTITGRSLFRARPRTERTA